MGVPFRLQRKRMASHKVKNKCVRESRTLWYLRSLRERKAYSMSYFPLELIKLVLV